MTDLEDTYKLLVFPSTSSAFCSYKPNAPRVADLDLSRHAGGSNTFNNSPPRKVARLSAHSDSDVDGDSSSLSANRAREQMSRADSLRGKGRGVGPAQAGARIIQRITAVQTSTTALSDDWVNDTLRQIINSIYQVLRTSSTQVEVTRSDEKKGLSAVGIYHAVQTIVLFTDKSHFLYEKLQFELRGRASQIAKELQNPPLQDIWLSILDDSVKKFNDATTLLQDFLTYLDGVYLKDKPDLMNIKQLAMDCFRKHVFEDAAITSQLVTEMKAWISWERINCAQNTQSRAKIQRILKALHNHGLLTPLFLQPYLNVTQEFYAEESERLSSQVDMKSTSDSTRKMFLAHCKRRIAEEKVRLKEVFAEYEWFWDEVERATEKALLTGRLEWLSKAIESTMDERNIPDLANMYNLFARVDGLKLLQDVFKAHVHKTVEAIVKDTAQDDNMVERLLDFKAFVDKAVPQAFADPRSPISASFFPSTSASASSVPSSTYESTAQQTIPNKEFQYAASDGFQTGFRARKNKPAEMIAKYLDKAMRKGQREASDEEFARGLDAALAIYRFTNDKDVFRTFYHRALAKRLLLQRSASDDFEKALLKKLKEEYDPEFSMGDHMFTDLTLSRDLTRDFHEMTNSESGSRLSVMVLQISFWPFSAKTKNEILLPFWMSADLKSFEEFYLKKHANRRLEFDHSLGTSSLHAVFDSGVKELSVSLYQTVVLLLFNDYDKLGYTDIKEHTQLADADLKRTLQSLACGKKKILRKEPAGRDVNNTDVFRFNAGFQDERYHVHINSIQSKETPEESKKTQHAIEGDRKHYLDAAIVRVMKAKKTQTHQQLISATIDSVKGHFVPEVRTIKERIEQMIEQEYMRRDDDADDVYVYIA